MEEFSSKNYEQELSEIDYSSKNSQLLIKEFTILLDNITSKYEEKIMEMENRYNRDMKSLGLLFKIYVKIKSIMVSIVRGPFRFVRKIAGWLGIKEKLKNTSLFKKLYKKGIIDKFADR